MSGWKGTRGSLFVLGAAAALLAAACAQPVGRDDDDGSVTTDEAVLDSEGGQAGSVGYRREQPLGGNTLMRGQLNFGPHPDPWNAGPHPDPWTEESSSSGGTGSTGTGSGTSTSSGSTSGGNTDSSRK